MDGMKIGIIGCGNMGGAIARGVVNKGLVSPGSILLNDKDMEKASRLEDETGCAVKELKSLVQDSGLIIIAVKPQDSEQLFSNIAADISEQTIVSVMAGVKIAAITEKIGSDIAVARAMPNLAAFVSESITSISFNDKVENTGQVKNIFTGIGAVLEVREELMDAVTAISGSGPAYLFYLAEAMMEAGRDAGLGDSVAKELVEQTLFGSASYLIKAGDTPGELVEKVASRGGTTEAALSVFDEKGMKSIIKSAISKAKERSRELSGG